MSNEFNRQYNNIVDSCGLAEEKSRKYGSEFQSEIMMFQEAKN